MATRRTEQKQRTREHVYETAMRLFDERGFEAVSIDDVVRACGIARGTFYFHFPTKDDVLLDAVRRGELHILARLAELPPRAKLRRVFERAFEAFVEAWAPRRPLLAAAGAVALRHIAAIEVENESDPLRRELAARVDAALARGELRSPLPGAMLADIFLLNVFAALMAWSRTGEPAPELMIAGVLELYFGGVRGLGRGLTR